jgi:hypothetical protein
MDMIDKTRLNLIVTKKAKEILRKYAFYKNTTQSEILEQLLLNLEKEVERLKKES